MTSKITEFVESIGRVAEREYNRGHEDGYEAGHRDGYETGYNRATAELEEAIAQWLKKRVSSDGPEPAELPSVRDRVLDFIREHPGTTAKALKEAGLPGQGTIYKLIKDGLVTQLVIPHEKREKGKPYVHFYPAITPSMEDDLP